MSEISEFQAILIRVAGRMENSAVIKHKYHTTIIDRMNGKYPECIGFATDEPMLKFIAHMIKDNQNVPDRVIDAIRNMRTEVSELSTVYYFPYEEWTGED